eukprot:TRINITY_DN8085_c0_g1_i1.p1 TRINITY_DN8085_c0_g1~~TRINITY_DN8085_c0_g1_i1.p1  ORF type:complete len:220 (+),score=53.31 TRINITY_DN8085_c0_g1_i1:50-709(+)
MASSKLSLAEFVRNVLLTSAKGMLLWGSFRWGVSFVESFQHGERDPGLLRRASLEGIVKGAQMGFFVAGSKTLQLILERMFGSSSLVDFVSGSAAGTVFIFRGESNWAYLGPVMTYILDSWSWSMLFRGYKWPPLLYRFIVFLIFGYLFYLYETQSQALRPYVVRSMDYVWKDEQERRWDLKESVDPLVGASEDPEESTLSDTNRLSPKSIVIPGAASY